MRRQRPEAIEALISDYSKQTITFALVRTPPVQLLLALMSSGSRG